MQKAKETKGKLTFRGVEDRVGQLIDDAYRGYTDPGVFDLDAFLDELKDIRKVVSKEHPFVYARDYKFNQ